MITEVKYIVNKQVENYKKPTPDKWSKAGKVIKYSGRLIAGLTLLPALASAWWVPIAAYVVGETGDFLINLKTIKE